MYKTIYVPVDNSDYSNLALDVGVSLAKTFGAKLVGSHVYAAKMHDKRFKQMEAGLPEEYHDENELERQRQIHDSLITRGLQIITDSYLDIVDKKAAEANIPVERRSLEGRNFKVLVEDINTNAYDLVIMGALGVGAVKDSVIGGVTERVIRRVRASDIFVIKNTLPMNGGSIVVALDGSHYSFGGLKTALALGKALNKPVEAVSAFDPYFHYAAFHSISGVLNEEAGKVFRFKEQEKLHEEIIDSGLAKIYQSHLDISRELAQTEHTDIRTTLLDGKAFEKVIQYVRKEIEKGHTIISNTVVDAAVGHILPKGAMDAMKALGGSLDAAGIDRNKMQADDAVAKDLMGSTLSGMMTEIVQEKSPSEKPAVSAGTQAYLDRMTQNYFVCDGCGYIGKGDMPVKCPVCGAEGARFKQVDRTIFEAAAKAEGTLETELAYDDVPMQWTKDAKEAIRAVPAGFQRRRAKAKIEKTARKLGMTTITLEYAAPMIKEAAAEDYTPIFANKGAATAPAAEAERAAAETPIAQGGNGASPSPYTWTSEAQQRLERVPAGFMRDCTRALIHKHADKLGTTSITLEVANQGIEHAKGTMEEAMKTGNLKDIVQRLTGAS